MACKIDHRVENNGLYKILKLSIHGGELCQYLMEKYDWDLNIFSSINWTAHNRELQKVPKHKKPTLLKYIHRWLAWKTRRHYEGQSKTTGCPLCGEPETRAHLFCFVHEQMSILRDTYWKILIKEIFKDTAVGFREVFISGLNTIPYWGWNHHQVGCNWIGPGPIKKHTPVRNKLVGVKFCMEESHNSGTF